MTYNVTYKDQNYGFTASKTIVIQVFYQRINATQPENGGCPFCRLMI